jgi:hypothetical protein
MSDLGQPTSATYCVDDTKISLSSPRAAGLRCSVGMASTGPLTHVITQCPTQPPHSIVYTSTPPGKTLERRQVAFIIYGLSQRHSGVHNMACPS